MRVRQLDEIQGAVEQLTRIFAKEVGSRGINVNAVSPGPTETALFLEGKSQQDIERLIASNAYGRLGKPEDIARVIVSFPVRQPGGYQVKSLVQMVQWLNIVEGKY